MKLFVAGLLACSDTHSRGSGFDDYVGRLSYFIILVNVSNGQVFQGKEIRYLGARICSPWALK